MNLWRRSSRKWRGVDFMALVPEKACGWAEGDGPDQVIVLQPRFSSGLTGRFLQPRLGEKKKYIRIPLEPRGSFLWKKMNGSLTVGELVAAFGQDFPEESGQVPERVATYLYQMAENKLIRFVNLAL